MRPETIRQRNQEYLQAIWALAPRDAEGSCSEADLLDAAKRVIPRDDPEKQHERKCKKFLEDVSHPGSTEPAGQLQLPFLNEVYDYEPDRPVIGPDQRVIEQKNAPPSFKQAEVDRIRETMERLQVWERRKAREAAEFQQWALEQALKGRPALELTWGNCIKERGFLQ
jgi:hypothetical protein